MRAEIEKIQQMMESADYVTDPAIATSVHLAMTLKKPLLIEGHAGVGKTEVAKVMARMLHANLIRLQCYEGLDAAQALASLHADHNDEELVLETLGCVLKDADDVKRFKRELTSSGLKRFVAAEG